MKALTYISLITVLILTSCTQSLYMGAGNDDLYYRPSDQVVVIAENREIPQEETVYYDEVYTADTLIADFYYDNDGVEGAASGYDDGSSVDPFVYYDDFSYASRINRFHGNYLYPYWRGSWNNPYLYAGPSLYMGYGFGYRSRHYGFYGHYDPFFYDPFYYSAIHSSYYYGYYPSYYSRYSYYSPYSYGYGTGYLSGYGMPLYGGSSGRDYTATVARRQTYSTVSDRYLAGTGTSRTASATTNRIATGSRRTGEATGTTGIANSTSRRTATTVTDPAQKGVYQTQNRATQVTSVNRRSTQASGTGSTAVVSRPTYVSTDRSYTPTYNNPRITTRPSYNTSRANATTIIPSGNTRTNRTVSTNVRTQTSISTNPVRSGSTGVSTINRTINSVIPSMGTRSTTTGRTSIGTSVSTGRTSSGTSVSTGRTSTSSSSGSTGRTSTSTSSSRTTSTGRTGGR